MRRRDFIVVLGSAAASLSLWPHEALGQQKSKVHRIGYLGLAPAATSATRVEAFLAGLRDLGYVEDKNLVIEFRWGNNPDQLRELAAELVLSNVELIFGTSSTEVGAARQATTTIPIVFATHADPVGTGHVASLARPAATSPDYRSCKPIYCQGDRNIERSRTFGDPLRYSVEPVPSHQPTVDAARAAGKKLGLTLHIVDR